MNCRLRRHYIMLIILLSSVLTIMFLNLNPKVTWPLKMTAWSDLTAAVSSNHSASLKPLLPSSPVSKDVIIYRVYFDHRKKTKENENQTVFFVVGNWTIYLNNWIVGCGVNGNRADQFHIRLRKENGHVKKVSEWSHDKYEGMFIDCFDLPVRNGDRAFLLYKTRAEMEPIVVESEYGVIVPQKLTDPYTVITSVACVKAYSKLAPFLGEFIQYQETLRVDHVSLTTISSFIKDGGLKYLLTTHPYVVQLFTTGYATIDLWKTWYRRSEIHHYNEGIRKTSCLYNYLGTYDYAIPVDPDDFFTPRLPYKKNIKYYLMNYCHAPEICSCALNWTRYNPDDGLNKIIDGNATAALKSLKSKTSTRLLKSIHRIDKVFDIDWHMAKKGKGMMPYCTIAYLPRKICEFSHIRTNSPQALLLQLEKLEKTAAPNVTNSSLQRSASDYRLNERN